MIVRVVEVRAATVDPVKSGAAVIVTGERLPGIVASRTGAARCGRGTALGPTAGFGWRLGLLAVIPVLAAPLLAPLAALGLETIPLLLVPAAFSFGLAFALPSFGEGV
jgi:hypothetical protein